MAPSNKIRALPRIGILQTQQGRFFHTCLKKNEKHIVLAIGDDGQGFDVVEAFPSEGLRKGLGLTSMKERAEHSGGCCTFQSAAGKGTIIQVSWPMESLSG